MKFKFYINEVPNNISIWDFIKIKTDINKYIDTMQPSVDASNLLTLKHEYNINEIIQSALEMKEKFGFKGWRSREGEMKSYGGLSLVCNPNYTEDTDPNQQTLGTAVNKSNEFFYSQVDRFDTIKNTYFDSYAFRALSPCVKETNMHSFIKSFKRHLIRSRLATINSQFVPANFRSNFGWHRDEFVFENLRINIPITTDETFMFQIVDKKPVHLSIGNMYSWDTNIAHRVFPTTEDQRSRTHLVLGFSPWFDYDEQEDCYYSNEFFGEMHPIDMLVNGHISEKIKGLL